MLTRLVFAGILIVLGALPVSAEAAMYAYVDARGICHYTNVPGDGRYKLSSRTPRRIDSPEDQLIKTIVRRSSNGLSPGGLMNSGNGYFRSNGYAFRTAPQTINRYIQLAAANHQVDPLLIKAVIKAESNFDPTALSPKGAQGLMQLMPGTAKDMAVNDPFDPLQNINGGTKYLRYLLDNFKGNVELSLAAYNAGPGNVAPYGVVPGIPETQNYVAKVMETYRSYRNGTPPLSSQYQCQANGNRQLSRSPKILNLPNLITGSRFILSGCLTLLLLQEQTVSVSLIAWLVFSIAAGSDWIDGYFARKYKAITVLGQLMDPLADKVLVATALIMLIPTGKLPAWVALIILCREIVVTGLGGVASSSGIVVGASSLGKWKSTIQYVGLGTLIFPLGVLPVPYLHQLGLAIIYVAVVLTVWSGIDYFYKLRRIFIDEER